MLVTSFLSVSISSHTPRCLQSFTALISSLRSALWQSVTLSLDLWAAQGPSRTLTVSKSDMATNNYASGYADNGVVNWKGYQLEYGLKERGSDEAEKGEPVTDVSSKVSQDPFGDETRSEVKYRTMHWWQAGMIMIAETISLGILSLPSVLAATGFVPYDSES